MAEIRRDPLIAFRGKNEQKWQVASVIWSVSAIVSGLIGCAEDTRRHRAGRLACTGGWLAGLAAALLALPAAALQLRDDRGVTVNLPAPPARIVSLLPSLAETVCELGQCQRLVGVDRYANWPARVRKLPRVGGGLDPDIEAVLALKPDVVLLATSSRAAARLESLGVKVIALEPKSHADVRRVLVQVARVLGLPDAEGDRVWRQIDAGLAEAAASVPLAGRGARVYFEVSSGPYAAGESSFIGETLTRLGAHNIVPASAGAFPKLNPEFVVQADPDLIMIGDENFTTLAGRPGWAGMRAVKSGRVCVFTPEQADTVVRAGPRLVAGARLVADCLATLERPGPKKGVSKTEPRTAGAPVGAPVSGVVQ